MILRACIALVLAAAALAALYTLGRNYEKNAYPEERQQMSDSFGRLHAVEYEGRIYVRRPEVTTLLIMGVDREGDEEPEGFRDGGQADFLMLVVLDHKQKTVSRLQIDRDAVTDVPVVGVLGNDAGTRRMQICLAHAYGGSEEERCRHTVQAAANLLAGEAADQCMSLMLDDIGVLNGVLGGVTVTIPEDLTAVDPAFTEGALITLTDEQAEAFVRARMSVGDGTILVAKYRSTHRREMLEAKQQLLQTGTPILGCILNDVTFDTLSSKRYYGKGYYYHHYGYYRKDKEKGKDK